MYVLTIVISLFGAGTLWSIDIPGYYKETHCNTIANDISIETGDEGSFFLNVGYTCTLAE